MSECPEKLRIRRQQGRTDSKPTGFIAASRLTPVAREDPKVRFPKEKTSCKVVSPTPRPVMEVFEPFIHEGSVSLSSDLSDAVTVKIFEILELHSWQKPCPLMRSHLLDQELSLKE